MIVEYTRYKITDERREQFFQAYEKAAEYLKSSPACLAYELSRCSEEPLCYILRIEWKSTDDHLTGFRGGVGFKPFFQLVQPFFHDLEEMQHYQLTEVGHRS